ncbi:heavy metal-associated domain-containing protein [Nocardia sp. NPDC051463]|uniref:heavy-metal-associated domain-containing protein n=1 Tax=Nocardia sp. NPDC051463 TaxID=3154845 RepID=UPI00341B36DE
MSTTAQTTRVELTISGMTCGSCVNRVERALNEFDGVTATIDLATETARVDHPAGLSPADLVAAVEQAGYRAELAGSTVVSARTTTIPIAPTSVRIAESVSGCCRSR